MVISKILVADDHRVVMVGVSEMLKWINPKFEIEFAHTMEEVQEQIQRKSYDLLILDIKIRGGGTPKMVSSIKRHNNEIKILMFSALDESLYAYPYLQAGADGFLHKSCSDEELRVAVEKLSSGGKYLSVKVTQETIDRVLNGNDYTGNRLFLLSPREIQIVYLLQRGATTREIGAQMCLQVSTISTIKMKIFRKLGVSNIVEMLNYLRDFSD